VLGVAVLGVAVLGVAVLGVAVLGVSSGPARRATRSRTWATVASVVSAVGGIRRASSGAVQESADQLSWVTH
jgi:hypothetical protein